MNWHDRFLQQAGWTRELREYVFQQAGLDSCQRILEVGCGTGAVLAGLSSSTGVHGLDLDLPRLIEARRHAPFAFLTCGDARLLPYEKGSFEISFCHFLLLWVADPLQALKEMKRVTRAGGAVLAFAEPDYASRRDEPASLVRLGRLQTESLQRQGADCSMGRKLGDLFTQAGITLRETGVYQTDPMRMPSLAEQALEWEVLVSDLSAVIMPDEIEKFRRIDEEAWRQGERLMHVPTYFAFGVV